MSFAKRGSSFPAVCQLVQLVPNGIHGTARSPRQTEDSSVSMDSLSKAGR